MKIPRSSNAGSFLLVALTVVTLTITAIPSSAKSRLPASRLAPNDQPVQGWIRWLARYDGPAHDFDLISSTVLSPDNTRIYVTGSSPDTGAYNVDYATIAYDAATGAPVWTARYDGPAHHLDNGRFIAVSADGTRVFVTGDSNADGSDSNYDFATIAYDAATGAQLWVARYDFAEGKEEVADIGVSPDGARVYITGTSQVFETNHDYATVAYSAAS